jgi:hypothetical protein
MEEHTKNIRSNLSPLIRSKKRTQGLNHMPLRDRSGLPRLQPLPEPSKGYQQNRATQRGEPIEKAYRCIMLPRGRVVGAGAPAEEVPRDELRRPATVRPTQHEPHRFGRHPVRSSSSSTACSGRLDLSGLGGGGEIRGELLVLAENGKAG